MGAVEIGWGIPMFDESDDIIYDDDGDGFLSKLTGALSASEEILGGQLSFGKGQGFSYTGKSAAESLASQAEAEAQAEATATMASKLYGAVTGAVAGGVAGSFVPVIGTAMGALLGAALGFASESESE